MFRIINNSREHGFCSFEAIIGLSLTLLIVYSLSNSLLKISKVYRSTMESAESLELVNQYSTLFSWRLSQNLHTSTINLELGPPLVKKHTKAKCEVNRSFIKNQCQASCHFSISKTKETEYLRRIYVPCNS